MGRTSLCSWLAMAVVVACDEPPPTKPEELAQEQTGAVEVPKTAEERWEEERLETAPLAEPEFANGSMDLDTVKERRETVRLAGVRLTELEKELPEGHPISERLDKLQVMYRIFTGIEAYMMAVLREDEALAAIAAGEFVEADEKLARALKTLNAEENQIDIVDDGIIEGFDRAATIARLEKKKKEIAKRVAKQRKSRPTPDADTKQASPASPAAAKRAELGLPPRPDHAPWAGDVEGLTAVESIASGCLYWRLSQNPGANESGVVKKVAKQYRLKAKHLDLAYGLWVHAKTESKGPWPTDASWCE